MSTVPGPPGRLRRGRGVYRGIVSRLPTEPELVGWAFVTIPRLNPDREYGPCEAAIDVGAMPIADGDRVLVDFLEGRADDVVIVGRLGAPVAPSGSPGDLKAGIWSAAPPGYLLCVGQAVNQADYPALYAVVGSQTWGLAAAPAGQFRIPDYRGRGLIGAGQGSGLSLRTLGQMLGAETVALALANLAAHTHGHAHAHSMVGHTHAISHAHAMAAHTHDLGNHTHAIPNHQHAPQNGGRVLTDAVAGVATYGVQNGSFYNFRSNDMNTDGGGGATGGPSANSAGPSTPNTDGPNTANSGPTNTADTGPASPSQTTDAAGSGTAHENMSPAAVVNWAVRY